MSEKDLENRTFNYSYDKNNTENLKKLVKQQKDIFKPKEIKERKEE